MWFVWVGSDQPILLLQQLQDTISDNCELLHLCAEFSAHTALHERLTSSFKIDP